MGKTAFIIGMGQIGYAIARRLLSDGWRVSVAYRSANAAQDFAVAGVSVVSLDRDDRDALASWLSSGADVLVDTVAFTQAHAQQLLTFQDAVGMLCVISSASVYCDDQGRSLDEAGSTGFPQLPCPIAEDNRTVAPSDDTYSTRKVAIEQTLLQRSGVPVTIVRPCAVYGIKSRHPREWWLVKRFLDGRRVVPLAFRGQSRFHTSATENIAEVIRTAVETRFNGVLNAADPQSLSVREIANVVSSALSWGCVPNCPNARDNNRNVPFMRDCQRVFVSVAAVTLTAIRKLVCAQQSQHGCDSAGMAA